MPSFLDFFLEILEVRPYAVHIAGNTRPDIVDCTLWITQIANWITAWFSAACVRRRSSEWTNWKREENTAGRVGTSCSPFQSFSCQESRYHLRMRKFQCYWVDWLQGWKWKCFALKSHLQVTVSHKPSLVWKLGFRWTSDFRLFWGR